ncbi:DUF998 domain-containing protein [Demequina sp. NBRC 110055]|uniref:DUF998 domain-containing protein n=1 Tax=Demequina sp. NBRC 110055 TaxID=1570344 RepID=UPI000A048081|nr:DUF998 domain-containing protein [Demequina sp. NBRC 110055]
MEATTLSPRTTGRVPLSVAALGLAGMYTGTIWVAVVLTLHVVRDDLDPCCSAMGDYAAGDLEWLMQAGFAIVGFGWMGVGIALRRALHGVAGARVLRTILLAVGTGLVFAGVFPVGDTMHTAGGVVAWAGLVAFGIAAALTFARTPTWHRLATAQVIFAVSVLSLGLAAMVWGAQVGEGFGWWERALAVLVMPCWLAHLGWTLNRAASKTPQRPSPSPSV